MDDMTNILDENTQSATEEKPKKSRGRKKVEPRVTSKKPVYQTWEGHPLTRQEALFIDAYMENGSPSKSYIIAYPNIAPEKAHSLASNLLNKPYILSEIQYRLELHKADSIASADEILQYLTAVMRGDLKDQFGLDAPLAERTKAAMELAKRQIDMPNRLAQNETPQLKIVLDWARPEVAEEISEESLDDSQSEE